MSTQANQWATLWTAQQQLHRSGLQPPRQLEHLPYILTAVFNGMTGNLLDQRCSQSPKTVVLNGIVGTVLDRRKFNAKTNYFSMFWPNLLGRYLQKGASLVRCTERGDILEMQVEKGIKIKNRLVIDCLRQWSWIGRKKDGVTSWQHCLLFSQKMQPLQQKQHGRPLKSFWRMRWWQWSTRINMCVHDKCHGELSVTWSVHIHHL